MKRLIILILIAVLSACTIQLHVRETKPDAVEDTLPDISDILEEDPEHGGFVVIEGDTIRLSKTMDELSYLSPIADSIEFVTIHGATGSKTWKRFTALTVSNYIEAADSTDMLDSLAAARTELADSTAAVRADFPAGGGGTMTAAQVEDSLATLTYDDRLSLHAVKDKPIYLASEYGVLPDGTDMTSALLSLLDTLEANNGGVIQYKEGTYRFDGLIRFPNDGTSPPRQKTIAFIGSGAYKAGTGSGDPNGGTIFDLRYSTTSDSARIITNGQGHLSIEGITFRSDNATASMPFIYTTNTTLSINQCAFYGRNNTYDADETAIKLGAVTTVEVPDGTDNSPFQGYGTVIADNYFNYIERGVHGGTFCNAVSVRDNTWWNRCGGQAAIEWNDGAAVQNATGNVIKGNLIEMNGYRYGMEFQSFSGNSIVANNFYDHGDSATAEIYFHDDAVYNYVQEGFSNFATRVTQDGTSTNTIVTPQQSSPSEFPQGVTAIGGGFETSVTDGAYRVNTATGGEWKTRLYSEKYAFNYTPSGGSQAVVFSLESTGAGSTATFEMAGTSQNILQAQSGELRIYSSTGQALWLGTNQSSAYRAYVLSGGFYSPSASKAFAMREVGQVTWSSTSSPGGTDIKLGRQDANGFYVKKADDSLGEINTESVKLSTDTLHITSGSGSPESVNYGFIGSVYLDKTNGLLYQKKTSSGGNTGWLALNDYQYAQSYHTGGTNSSITNGTAEQINATTTGTVDTVVVTSEFTVQADGDLQYIGANNSVLKLDIDLSIATGSIGDMYYYIAINGVEVANTRIRRDHGNSDYGALSIQYIDPDADTNDVYSVFAEPVSSTEDVTISDCRITAEKIQ